MDEDVGANGLQSAVPSRAPQPFLVWSCRRARTVPSARRLGAAAGAGPREPGHLQPGAGGPGRRPTAAPATAALSVRVLDANDHSPGLPREGAAWAEVELAEDAPVGSLLLDLDAADPDEGPNGDVVFAFGPAPRPRRAASSAWTRAPAASPGGARGLRAPGHLRTGRAGAGPRPRAPRRHLQGHRAAPRRQ